MINNNEIDGGAKILAESILGSNIADNTISGDKLSTDLKKIAISIPVSFEAANLNGVAPGVHMYKFQTFGGTILDIEGVVTDLIEATDNATSIVYNETQVAALNGGTITWTAGATPGTNYQSNITAKGDFNAGDNVTVLTTKTTPGGKGYIVLTIQIDS